MAKLIVFFLVILGAATFAAFTSFIVRDRNQSNNNITSLLSNIIASPTPSIILQRPPSQKILPATYHVFQSFNNCGPASLSMALRFYGINISQEELGLALRPYQVASGDNDDKSVTLAELAAKSKEYGFIPYHRPNGNIEMIKLFITYDMPVIARTWLHSDEDIGHYRVVKGYDSQTNQIIQDDSFENKNLWYSNNEFNEIWKKFNYEYLVLVPQDKKEIADAILGPESDENKSWEKAVDNARFQISQDPDDTYTIFNLSVALYNTRQYQKSVEEFEKVENKLSQRTLWYQIEPIKAYYELGNYSRVFKLTNKILNGQNRAFSELYIIRGKSYQKQGNDIEANNEFEKAKFYNKNISL